MNAEIDAEICVIDDIVARVRYSDISARYYTLLHAKRRYPRTSSQARIDDPTI